MVTHTVSIFPLTRMGAYFFAIGGNIESHGFKIDAGAGGIVALVEAGPQGNHRELTLNPDVKALADVIIAVTL